MNILYENIDKKLGQAQAKLEIIDEVVVEVKS